MEDHNLVKNTLDQIPHANSNAKRIVGLVKEGGRITGYQLSDNSIVEKQQSPFLCRLFYSRIHSHHSCLSELYHLCGIISTLSERYYATYRNNAIILFTYPSS